MGVPTVCDFPTGKSLFASFAAANRAIDHRVPERLPQAHDESSFSVCEIWFASEYLVGLIPVSAQSGQMISMAVRAYIADHCCLEEDVIANRLIHFSARPMAGDLLCIQTLLATRWTCWKTSFTAIPCPCQPCARFDATGRMKTQYHLTGNGKRRNEVILEKGSDIIGKMPILSIATLTRSNRLLLKIEKNIWRGIKDRMGRNMVVIALKPGRFKPGGVVVEPYSGSTNIGLAIAIVEFGLRFIAVVD